MATLVCYDPETGCEKTSPKTIQRPQGEPGYRVKNGMGQMDDLRSNESVKERSSLVDTTNDDTVPYTATKNHASTGWYRKKIQEESRHRTCRVMNEWPNV